MSRSLSAVLRSRESCASSFPLSFSNQLRIERLRFVERLLPSQRLSYAGTTFPELLTQLTLIEQQLQRARQCVAVVRHNQSSSAVDKRGDAALVRHKDRRPGCHCFRCCVPKIFIL